MGAYLQRKTDPSMHRTYVSLTNNLTRTLGTIEQYLRGAGGTSPPPGLDAEVTNAQLLIASLRQVARTLDRSERHG
ncbi:MAG: hypothetical protein PHW58_02380 [Candidatus Methanofastidiosa archaeon]|jgi:hypothetical protein|nr:hypothetical protein [Candidatus Methanofastidiosa archaeon]